MFVQIVSVVAVILAHRWTYWPVGPFILPVEVIARTATWFMVALSLVSAADYFVAFWAKIDKTATKTRQRRRRVFVLNRRKDKDVPAT
jgi:CDP-diacylglycerol--glycerol-3-phosphate 3-phosphatidyltransferase